MRTDGLSKWDTRAQHRTLHASVPALRLTEYELVKQCPALGFILLRHSRVSESGGRAAVVRSAVFSGRAVRAALCAVGACRREQRGQHDGPVKLSNRTMDPSNEGWRRGVTAPGSRQAYTFTYGSLTRTMRHRQYTKLPSTTTGQQCSTGPSKHDGALARVVLARVQNEWGKNASRHRGTWRVALCGEQGKQERAHAC